MAIRSIPWTFPGYDRKCVQCHTEFRAHHQCCIYCSDECAELRDTKLRAKARAKYIKKRAKLPKPKCNLCNRAYVKDYPQQRYCPRHNQ